MAITRAAYCTRERVKQAADIKLTTHNDWQVDDAIEAAADSVDGLLHRVFYTTLATKYVDWPNFQGTYPWKIYLDAAELADVTGTVPVVTTGGSSPQTIPAANLLWGPWNYAPPYTRLEIDRSTNSAFGLGSTPQRDVHITGLFGFQDVFRPAGALAASMSDTTGTVAQVTNGAAVGVGDIMLVDAERMLVTDKAMVTTAQTQQGSGVSTASKSDQLLAVTDGTKYAAQEVLLLDAERMLIVDIAGNNLSVIRGWDGTTLATHSAATVYALRELTVTRGAFGSTATTHSLAAACSVAVVPGLIRQLALAEAIVDVAQQVGAYAQVQGDGASKVVKIGQGLPDLRARALAQFGRTGRRGRCEVAFDFQALTEAVASYAASTGEFDTVNTHEPKAKPGNGVTCSIWVDEINPVASASGLNAVTGLVTMTMRIQRPGLSQPADQIDPLLMAASASLMAKFAAGFTMTGIVRNVDLLGQHSQGVRARAGYVNQDGTIYRVMDVMLPLVVNDLYPEEP